MTVLEMRAKAQKLTQEAIAELIAGNDARAKELKDEAFALDARADDLAELEARNASFNTSVSVRPTEDRSMSVSADEAEIREYQAYLHGEARVQSKSGGESAAAVPQTYTNEIIRSQGDQFPMLNPAVVRAITTPDGTDFNWPALDTTGLSANAVNELGTANAAVITFTNKQMNAFKFQSEEFGVSTEVATDSRIPLEPILNEVAADSIGLKLNAVYTNGSGSGEPEGVLTASVTGYTTLSNAAITYDDLVELEHSVPAAYRVGAAFMMSDAVLKEVRKIKDVDGQPLVLRSLQVGAPATLFGYPIYINNAMPSFGAGNKVMLFGNFKKFITRQVGGLYTNRYLNKNDTTSFITYSRNDSMLADARAIKHLKIKS